MSTLFRARNVRTQISGWQNPALHSLLPTNFLILTDYFALLLAKYRKHRHDANKIIIFYNFLQYFSCWVKKNVGKSAIVHLFCQHLFLHVYFTPQTHQIPRSGIASVASSRQRRCKIEATVRTILKSHRFHRCQFFRPTEP